MPGEINIADLVVSLKGDTSDLRKDLTLAERMAKGFGRSVQRLGKVALGGLTTVAAGSGFAVRGMMRMAKEARGFRSVRKAFNQTAESAGVSGDKMLDSLEDASAGMVSQQALMANFNEAAQLVNDQFAKQLPTAISATAKIAASQGKNMQRVVGDLITGVGRMSREVMDNLGVTISMAEATELAAKMFDKEESAITQTEKQAAFQRLAIKRLKRTAQGLPDVTNQAGTAMQRFSAQLENVKREIGSAVLPILAELAEVALPLLRQALPPIKSALQAFADIVRRGASAFERFHKRVGRGLPVLDSLKIAVTNLFPDDVANAINNTIDTLARFWNWVKKVTEPIRTFYKENTTAKDRLIALGIAIAAVIIPALMGIIGPVLLALATFLLLSLAVSKIREAWKKDWKGIRTFTMNALTQIKSAVRETLPAIRGFWQKHGAQIKQIGREAWTTLATIIKLAINIIKQTILIGLAILRGDWSKAWQLMKKATINNLKLLRKIFRGIIDNLLKTIKQRVLPAFRNFKQQMIDMWETIKARLASVWQGIKSTFKQIVTWLKTTLTNAAEGFKKSWQNAMDPVKDAVDDVKDGLNKLKDAAEGLWDFITGRTFDFHINIPDIPDWATPGSKIPLHKAWVDFERDLRFMHVEPQFDVPANVPGMTAAARASETPGRQYQQVNNYQMDVHTSATVGTVRRDFESMRARTPSAGGA